MSVKLLTEHNLEFLSLKGGCIGSSESTHVKMPHCWKSHALAHLSLQFQANSGENHSFSDMTTNDTFYVAGQFSSLTLRSLGSLCHIVREDPDQTGDKTLGGCSA